VINETLLTRSGVYARIEPRVGLFCFSPTTCLLFAVAESESRSTLQWLQGGPAVQVSDATQARLGKGWFKSKAQVQIEGPQLLPTAESWGTLPILRQPLAINWLITGQCPLACRYCYAEDLMRSRVQEPERVDVQKIADAILRYSPLYVVLTGGDPLFSPFLRSAIESLSGKTGIIVDTSAYTLTKRHVETFRDHGVGVRISVDSARPKVNDSQRIVYSELPIGARRGGALERALRGIDLCLDADVSLTIQTVATKKNANDLVDLGDRLFRMGVKSWRVFKVAPSQLRMSEYLLLVGGKTDKGGIYSSRKKDGPYKFVFKNLVESHRLHWKASMALQLTMSESPNSVVLVSADGRFFTESNTGQGKVLIDPRSPRRPSINSLATIVDMAGHASRYLNLEYGF
jgi:pyruvate-formate lyase-activating enzyme